MPRPRTYQTNAIIIKKTKLGEADRILSLYTPDQGKIQAVAKVNDQVAVEAEISFALVPKDQL